MPPLAKLAVFFVPFLVLSIAVVSGVIILVKRNTEKHRLAVQRAEAQASLWRSTLESNILRTVGVSQSIAGFISGAATTIPQHNGTLQQRMLRLSTSVPFSVFAQNLLDANPGLFSLQIQPSAVITDVYPAGTAPIGLDLYNIDRQKADIYNAIRLGGVVVAGPLQLVQGNTGLISRYPVFLNATKSLDTWWGNGVAVVILDRFVNATKISSLEQEGYNYHLEYVNQNTMLVETIAQSTLGLNKENAVQSIVRLPNGFVWTLYLAPMEDWNYSIQTSEVVLLIGVGIAGGATSLMCWLLLTRLWDHSQRNNSAAPRLPPVALLFTDIEMSTSIWVAHPKAMAVALVIHNRIIREQIHAVGAYEVKTLGDSFMIAARTPQIALDLAVRIQNALDDEPSWPQELDGFYGIGTGLRVRIGAHYCSDAECLFDEVSKGYDYVGNDVNLCSRIQSMANGGEILMSEIMARHAMALGAYAVEAVGTQFLRGIAVPQTLHRLRGIQRVNRAPYFPRTENTDIRHGRSPSDEPLNLFRAVEEQLATVLREYTRMPTAEYDGYQLRKWATLMKDVVQTMLGNLPMEDMLDILHRICTSLGIGGHANAELPRLTLHLSQLLIPKFPAVYPKEGAHPFALLN